MVREENYDVVIVGCGVGGLYTALNLPSEDRILMICKEDIESCGFHAGAGRYLRAAG